jgi:hypothetical protein
MNQPVQALGTPRPVGIRSSKRAGSEIGAPVHGTPQALLSSEPEYFWDAKNAVPGSHYAAAIHDTSRKWDRFHNRVISYTKAI